MPPSPNALPDFKRQRKLFELLDAHFSNGQYLAGYDDKRIAAETGFAPEYVAKARIDAFGELRQDPEIDKIKSDLTDLETMVTDLRTRFDAYVQRQSR